MSAMRAYTVQHRFYQPHDEVITFPPRYDSQERVEKGKLPPLVLRARNRDPPCRAVDTPIRLITAVAMWLTLTSVRTTAPRGRHEGSQNLPIPLLLDLLARLFGQRTGNACLRLTCQMCAHAVPGQRRTTRLHANRGHSPTSPVRTISSDRT
ncbi:hypothetical protein BU16DRAFT_378881 [Lophium mytilinum]|uniref:Uncharacterized protein n=1 Tax=Lophium mytilinum TaxID=390894 RepID=A0A6A6QSD9_9PEZI|nr:hypothetical protein BU16DRAFT_378881 [Lophium mytilinum]